VHLSHQFICRKLASEAKEAGAKSLVITFDPHPKMILHPAIRPFYLITTLEEKLKLLDNCEIDGVLVIPFSIDYSKVTAEEFVRDFSGKSWRLKKLLSAMIILSARAKRQQRLFDFLRERNGIRCGGC